MSCASKQSVQTTEKFYRNHLSDNVSINISKPESPHENKEGHDWIRLNNGQYMEYLKIGNQGETIIFVCGILDDSIVTFSNMPDLIKKAKKGRCQLLFVNLPGNGYSSIPDPQFFNPIYLKLCFEEFITKMKLKEFTLIGNSNGCLVSVLLTSCQNCDKDFKIKNLLGFNPLLKDVSFWEMDKYQKLLVKSPSNVVQSIIQTPLIGYQVIKFTLGSVENKWVWNVDKQTVVSFYNRLSKKNRCGIWSAYLKNAIQMTPELNKISNEIYQNISQRTEKVILYSNPGDNWVPHYHVKEIADKMNVTYKKLGSGHIPQRTYAKLVEKEILSVLNL